MRNIAATIFTGLTLLGGGGVAHADSTLAIRDGGAVFSSEDPSVANDVVVEEASGNRIRFFEPVDPQGINFAGECQPGRTRTAPNGTIVVIEVFCPRSALARSIAIEPGPAEDKVSYSVAGIPAIGSGDTGGDRFTSTAAANDALLGEQGNDALESGPGDDDLQGGEGNDTLAAGEGNDRLRGGEGTDAFEAGNGDDRIDSADGLGERVACGAGADTVTADTLDELVECETQDVKFVEPPAEQPGGPDTTKPRLQVAALSRQRVSRSRRSITVFATSSEAGLVQAAGFVSADGLNHRVSPARAKVAVGGGGAALRLTLTTRVARAVMRDLQRRRRPWIRITLSAVDNAGNTSAARRIRVYFRR